MASWGFRRLALIVAMSLHSASPLICASAVAASPLPPRLVQTITPAAAVSRCWPRTWWSFSSSLPDATTSLSRTSFKVSSKFERGFGKVIGTMSSRIFSSSSTTPPATSFNVTPDDVNQFWFREIDPGSDVYVSKSWFLGGPDFDVECGKNFGECLELARKGELSDWMDTSQGRLALIIVLDQLSRNIYRDSPLQFSQDERAREIALHTIQQGWHKEMAPWEKRFLYMPLMHSESLDDHEVAERLFKELADENVGNEKLYESLQAIVKFESKHHATIRKFGRYPSRNAILGRQNTVEEEEYLSKGDIW